MAKGKLTSVQRAAAVIIALGTERASSIYRFLKEDEVEQISVEVARLERLSQEQMQETIEDFYGLCVTQKVINEGGPVYAKEVLEKAFGPERAAYYLERLSAALKSRSFDFIRRADYKSLQTALQNEHPQTVALVLSYAKPEQASQIIAEFPHSVGIDIIERIARIESASPEFVGIVEEILARKFAAIVPPDRTEVGGVTYVADIMNRVDRNTEKLIFDELGQRSPSLAEDIRKLMFVFEDIVKLDSMAVQRFIREVDTKDLAIALKAANEEVRDVILRNMSSRMRESIELDIQYLHNIRMRDVEEVREKIIGIIRQLEEMGEIIIAKGEGDEIIA